MNCDICGSPIAIVGVSRHPACVSILLALTEMRDTPKRELLHKIIVAIARGVDD